MQYKPRCYQLGATHFLLANNRGALFMDMGLGKTSSVLNAIDTLIRCGEEGMVLVVAPLRVARNTWTDEINKWAHTRYLTVDEIVGTQQQRVRALQSDTQIKTINYENLVWLVGACGKNWPFSTIVFDESTKLKSLRTHYKKDGTGKPFMVCTGGARASAIVKHAIYRTERVWLLTGTPCQNSLMDLWAQIFFIDGGKRLGNSFTAFEDRWFKTGYNGYTKTPVPGAQEQIQDVIKDVVYTLRAEDYLDLGKEVVNTIYVNLPPKAEEQYLQMEEEMFTRIFAGKVEAFSAAAKTMKCRQIANGAIYYDDGKFECVHDEKLLALESVIEEANGMPVIVVYSFKSDLARLRKAFPKGAVFDKNPKTEKDFKAGKIPILFLHPDSAGHGVDGLQKVTNIICFYSVDWDGEKRTQTIARIGKVRQFQAGFNRPVFIHQIIARDTVDEIILDRVANKLTVEEALKKALAKRGKPDGH